MKPYATESLLPTATPVLEALLLVRRANLRGHLLCRRTDALFELEWRGTIQWVSGRGTAPGGYWACAAVDGPKPGLRKCSSPARP